MDLKAKFYILDEKSGEYIEIENIECGSIEDLDNLTQAEIRERCPTFREESQEWSIKLPLDKKSILSSLAVARNWKNMSYKNTGIGKYIYLASSSNKRVSKKNLKKIEKIYYTTEEQY